ncbi:MAG TPA: ferredoxin reductase family protein [Actinocrinis sp.]|uniref:ferredoxin reductase family protein n=1 Tax=Actinocrinis sp. TaxID=1920516 RepID=UPI002DDCB38F|nr:ferredoxin reductase family protein [Actinocrinis sp.]HEV3173536.1 ferredoxin reductase family protein [Actinocrinis sp.]
MPRVPAQRRSWLERGTATLGSVSLRTRDIVVRPAALQARPMRRRPRGANNVRPDVRVAVMLAAAAVGGVVLLGLFWADTQGLSFATSGEAFTTTGDALGMLAAYLLMVQVLMMARVPWLERGIGSDRLAAAHRRMGEWVVIVLIAHVGTIVVGYANGVAKAVPGEVVTLLMHTAYVGLAAVGTGFFLLIGLISLRAIRRRLPYELWYYIHLSVYVSLALAFAHQIVLGPTFSGNATARWAWGAAYVATGLAVIVFRIGGPLRLAYRHGLYVTAVKPEGPDTVSIYLGGRNLRRLGAQPGQFFRWRFLARGSWWQTHPFSLSAAPNREWLRVTVGALGNHSRALQNVKPGTRVLAEGPYGAFTAALRTRRKVLLLAGGIGITPLRALADALTSTATDIVLIYRASDMGEVVFAQELEWMQRNGRLTVHYLLGKRDAMPRPLSAERLKYLVPDVADRDVFLCGPPGMVEAARLALRRAGVNRRRLHHERFAF